jgi:hypothetical protein
VTGRPESAWRLRYDLAWANSLLWVARTPAGGEPKPEIHRFLADRYEGLARHHASRGRAQRARALGEKAAYRSRGGSDDSPRAAAMSMPIPQALSQTSAVGPEDPSDDVA